MRPNAEADPVLVEVTRGSLIESSHRGIVAVSDSSGQLRLALGDVDRPIYPRSAFKMMQALPLVESGAAAAFKLNDKELSLACASHSGELIHVRAVERWLKRIDCGEADLACGPHLPMNEAASRRMQRGRKEPTRLHNNCSGKHTGFLTLARHLGAPTAGYVDLDHPVQHAVKAAVGALCDLDGEALPWGIDGCAAPNFALPLRNLAMGFARIADPSGLAPERGKALKRLMRAVTTQPIYESGTGRSDLLFITAATGGTMTKAGAEGVHAAAIPSLGLGVALKVDDGAGRGAETAMAAVLSALGVLDGSSPAGRHFLAAPVKNWRGDLCGERRPAAALGNLTLA